MLSVLLSAFGVTPSPTWDIICDWSLKNPLSICLTHVSVYMLRNAASFSRYAVGHVTSAKGRRPSRRLPGRARCMAWAADGSNHSKSDVPVRAEAPELHARYVAPYEAYIPSSDAQLQS